MRQAMAVGLGVVVALTAWVGTASATTITSPEGTTYTGEIAAQSEGHVVFDNPIAKIECASSFAGKVESHGSGKEASGKLTSLTFTGCTNSWHVTVVSGGSFSIDGWLAPYGFFNSNGATIEATRFGITCRYATSLSRLGQITSGLTARLWLESSLYFHSGSVFCGTLSTSLTGSYAFTTPSPMYLDQ